MTGVRLDGFKAFKLHLAIQLHFTQDQYNIFSYKGKVKFPIEKFEVRNDKAFFYKFSEEYLKGDLANFYMANIMAGCTHVSEYTDLNFREWKSKMHRVDYLFEEDCKKLNRLMTSNGISMNDLFVSITGGIPVAIQLLNGGHISLETVCLIDIILDGCIMMRFDEQIKDKFVWPTIRKKIVKYQPWIRTDITSLKKILSNYK